jgi:hypothetical protein
LNGVIYAAGGYNGSSYVQYDLSLLAFVIKSFFLSYTRIIIDNYFIYRSAERYDPREGLWGRLPSMNTRRGCHALTVLGEELSVTSS